MGNKHLKIFSAFAISAAMILAGFLVVPSKVQAAPAASFSLSPNTGSFIVDSTFDVSIYLDTQGQSINTVELNLKFPPDKLQLASSSTGKSIIGIWTSAPKFDNQAGTIYLVGGIPGGITVSKGLVANLTFRVKSVGSAVVKFENSRVLLNNGLGTEILTQNYNSIYELTLPPPAGPIVVSNTHPDQTKWYPDTTLSLQWDSESEADAYSYVLNEKSIDNPDDISEGTKTDVVYKNLSEGRHYFHIRALRNGHWGGTSHFAVNIDPTPPADFQIEIVPDARTTRKQPVIQFATSDQSSGMDHYELNIIPLSKPGTSPTSSQGFFVEAQSPYVTNELELGKYDVIVRAIDKAGNMREVTKRMEIVTAVFSLVGKEGLLVFSTIIIPWYVLLLILLIFILALVYLIHRLHLWHRALDYRSANSQLPEDLQQQLAELQTYRQKYGHIASFLLIVVLSSVLAGHARAESQVLPPPVVETVSKNISDQDIFYIGGNSGVADADIIIYLQSLDSAATISETTKADKSGRWFYRHNTFLTPGSYLLWTQTKVGDQLSPPSAQIAMSVETTALHFGATRISFTTLYLTLTILFAIVILLLLAFIIIRFRHARRKHKAFLQEIEEAEASVRRGFAVLNRDIQSQLALIHQTKTSKILTDEEKAREEQLLKDLQDIEQYVSKEIWDVKELEST